jgi:hypothetical protein
MGTYYQFTVQQHFDADEYSRESWQDVATFFAPKVYGFANKVYEKFHERAGIPAPNDEWRRYLDNEMDRSAYQFAAYLEGFDFMAAVVLFQDDEDARAWEKHRANAIGAFIHALVGKDDPHYKTVRVFMHAQT